MKRQKSDYDRNAPFQSILNAARTTGLSQFYLRQGCKAGTVPHIKSGNCFMVNVPLLVQKLNAESLQNADKVPA